MLNFLLYLFESSICLTILFGVYLLFFQRETFFRFNRWYLLLIMFFSILTPIIHLSFSSTKIEKLETSVAEINKLKSYYSRLIALTDPEFDFPKQNTAYNTAFEEFSDPALREQNESFNSQSEGALESNASSSGSVYSRGKFPWILLIQWIYLAGIALFFFRLVGLFIWLMKMVRKSDCFPYDKYTIVQLQEEMPPFSFFRYVFVSSDVYNKTDFEQILAHEITHIRQVHSFDLFLAHSLSILQWINPLAWQLQKAIKTNHEYLADEQVIDQGFELFDYQSLLLTQLISIRSVNLVNNFNLLSIQKRIAMMTKVKSGFMAKLKVLLIVPFAIALFFFFADMTFYGSGRSVSNYSVLKQKNEISKFEGVWENADNQGYGRLVAFDATSISLLDDAFYLYQYKATMSPQTISIDKGPHDIHEIMYQSKGDDLYIWWNDVKPTHYKRSGYHNSIANQAGPLAAKIDLPTLEYYKIIDWNETFNLVFDGEKLQVGEKVGELSDLDRLLKEQKGSLNKLTMKRMTVKLFIDKNAKMEDVSAITNALRENGLLKVSYMAQPAGGVENVLLAHTYGRTFKLPPLEGVKLMSDDDLEEDGISVFEIDVRDEKLDPNSIRPQLKKFYSESEKYVTPIIYDKHTKYSLFMAYYDAVLVVLLELRNEYALKNYNVEYDDLSKEQQKEVRFAFPATVYVEDPV